MDGKIYSRKRFIIKKIILIALATLIITTIIYAKISKSLEPTFKTLCEEKVKSIATIITNQESTKIINKYQYDELYTIEKDENGNIVLIKSNIVPINNMISDLTENIQQSFNEMQSTQIDLKLGNLFGTYLFSGVGPTIPTKLAISGTIDTEIKSEFTSQGINQTLHKIYVDFCCVVKIITPFGNHEKEVVNQVLIAEHVIIGNIPETYLGIEKNNQ